MPRTIGWRGLWSGIGLMVVSMLISARALAVPLSYSEAVVGDLVFPSPAFVLDAGDNTITGTTRFDVNRPGGPRFAADFDSFAFTVPEGLQLASISLSFLTTTFNVSGANLELRLCQAIAVCGLDPAELLGLDAVDLLVGSSRLVDFGLPFPLAAGTYSLVTSGIGIGIAEVSIPEASWFADYTWKLAVHRIREPSALWLLALGLVVLMVARSPPES